MSYGSAPTHPGDRDLVQQTLDRASEARADFDEVKESCGCSSRLCDFEHRLLMPDGSVKHLHVSARALTTLSGDREFVGAVTDITAAKQAAEKSRQDERELRRITDAIPQLIIVYGPDGRPIYVNRVALEYIYLYPVFASHPFKLPLLEDPQERDLRIQWQLAHFIQK
jgi:PAS domain-containing protein